MLFLETVGFRTPAVVLNLTCSAKKFDLPLLPSFLSFAVEYFCHLLGKSCVHVSLPRPRARAGILLSFLVLTLLSFFLNKNLDDGLLSKPCLEMASQVSGTMKRAFGTGRWSSDCPWVEGEQVRDLNACEILYLYLPRVS